MRCGIILIATVQIMFSGQKAMLVEVIDESKDTRLHMKLIDIPPPQTLSDKYRVIIINGKHTNFGDWSSFLERIAEITYPSIDDYTGNQIYQLPLAMPDAIEGEIVYLGYEEFKDIYYNPGSNGLRQKVINCEYIHPKNVWIVVFTREDDMEECCNRLWQQYLIFCIAAMNAFVAILCYQNFHP